MKYVNILAKYEIVVGDKTGKFNPDASLTRAETAVVMAKLVKAISKQYGNYCRFDVLSDIQI